MKRLNAQDLDAVKASFLEWTAGFGKRVLVCTGAGCLSAGSGSLIEKFKAEVEAAGLGSEVLVMRAGCLGPCGRGPVVAIEPEGVVYESLDPEAVAAVVKEHLAGGRPVEKLLPRGSGEGKRQRSRAESAFFKGQTGLITADRPFVDPEDINSYIARDGYCALRKVLLEMSPALVISEIRRSGLRGRGGRGFPAFMKWESCMLAEGPEKFVVCNCDDGAPGAYAGRTILESSPHSIIEAMAIGAHAVGASSGFIYVRAEYETAVERAEKAIEQAREKGLLGKDVLGLGFDFDLRVFHGASALVCGESTALLAQIEGKPAEPRNDQVHSSERGLFGKPTLLNNVETWAAVPVIIRRGGGWFASIGSPSCPGTKMLSPGGRIANLGVIEVRTGTPLREILEGPCGGPGKGRRIKAVQVSGPGGGFIPARLMDTPLEYEALDQAGAMMCTGGIIAFDDRACMVEAARSSVEYMAEESCGKCAPCREGLPRILALLTSVCRGSACPDDIDLLEETAQAVKDASLCGLGRSAANPVLTSIRYWRDEYVAHVEEKRCPAGVCPDLTRFRIDAAACSGCGLCQKACPAGAISGEGKEPRKIKEEICLRCGACRDACRKDAIWAFGMQSVPLQKMILR